MNDLEFEDMKVSREAINTIVVMAAYEVEGVVSPQRNNSGLLGKLAPQDEISTDIALDGDKLRLGVHVQVEYGNPLPEIANKVRHIVADSVSTQLGLDVSSIDVYIDGIQFE